MSKATTSSRSKRASARTTKAKVQAKRPLASDPEYMRRRRLQLNPDVYSRISVKAKNYLTVREAELIENAIDKMIGLAPRNPE